MNSVDIERFLRDRVRNFDGVFSVDALSCMPRLLVCNIDPSYMPIYIYVKDGRGEYFDSFGRRPNSVLERNLNRHCSSWIFNERQLQSVASKLCGHYCIYFCLLRDRGINMRKFSSSFTSDTGLNDVLVHVSVCRRLRKRV